MTDAMPFFYYDILSKLIPGGLALGVLKLIGFSAPKDWSVILSRGTWATVVLPLALAAAAYMIGGLLDALFRWAFADGFGARGYARACQKFREPGLLPPHFREKYFHYDAWQWLALVAIKEYPSAFSLAHRFQAEARLYALSAVPAATLAGWSVFELFGQPGTAWKLFIILPLWSISFAGFAVAARNCEERRWLFVLGALAQLQDRWPARWLSPVRAQSEAAGSSV